MTLYENDHYTVRFIAGGYYGPCVTLEPQTHRWRVRPPDWITRLIPLFIRRFILPGELCSFTIQEAYTLARRKADRMAEKARAKELMVEEARQIAEVENILRLEDAS